MEENKEEQEQLQKLYKEIDSCKTPKKNEDIDHEKIIELCQETLQITPDDIEIRHVLVVALYEIDNFSDIKKNLTEEQANKNLELSFIYAYTLFKLNHLDTCLKFAKKCQEQYQEEIQFELLELFILINQMKYTAPKIFQISTIVHKLLITLEEDNRQLIEKYLSILTSTSEDIFSDDIVSKTLETICEHFKNSTKILHSVGNIYMKFKFYEKAIKIFEEIIEDNEDDKVAQSQLISAYEVVDMSKMQQCIGKWYKAADLIVDQEELENLSNDLTIFKQYKKIAAESQKQQQDAKQVKKQVQEKKQEQPIKPKKKKRIRYPKNYDPANPSKNTPNPERWLPKYERAEFIKKRKKGKFKGPQGEASALQNKSSILTFSNQQTSLNQQTATQTNRRKKR